MGLLKIKPVTTIAKVPFCNPVSINIVFFCGLAMLKIPHKIIAAIKTKIFKTKVIKPLKAK